jgi:probable metal-binding protein
MRTIHIHEVLHLLEHSGKRFTETGLLEEVKNNFGENIQFTSCSNNFFSPEGMVEFMLRRGKIEINDGIITLAGFGCEH